MASPLLLVSKVAGSNPFDNQNRPAQRPPPYCGAKVTISRWMITGGPMGKARSSPGCHRISTCQ
jgi:hypothetical protein